MISLAIFALMFTCLVDVIGQGLAFPIFAALLMQPNVGFLPAGVSQSQGSLLYGIAIGAFFLTCFLDRFMFQGCQTALVVRLES